MATCVQWWEAEDLAIYPPGNLEPSIAPVVELIVLQPSKLAADRNSFFVANKWAGDNKKRQEGENWKQHVHSLEPRHQLALEYEDTRGQRDKKLARDKWCGLHRTYYSTFVKRLFVSRQGWKILCCGFISMNHPSQCVQSWQSTKV